MQKEWNVGKRERQSFSWAAWRDGESLTVSLLLSLVCVPHHNSHTTHLRYNNSLFLPITHTTASQLFYLKKRRLLLLPFTSFGCPISVHFHPVKRANLVSSSFLSILLCCLYYIPAKKPTSKKTQHHRRIWLHSILLSSSPSTSYHNDSRKPLGHTYN